jgi:hypothetical protein
VILSALNQSMDSFDQAPAATLIEQKVLRWLCSAIGLPSASGGTFTPGGTVSNYMAMLLARDHFALRKWNWRSYEKGLPLEAERYRFICSAAAHFSVAKSAMQRPRTIPDLDSFDDQSMRVDALADASPRFGRRAGNAVAIIGTAGTTDFGAIGRSRRSARLYEAAAHGSMSMRPRRRIAPLGVARCVARDRVGRFRRRRFSQTAVDAHQLLGARLARRRALRHDQISGRLPQFRSSRGTRHP